MATQYDYHNGKYKLETPKGGYVLLTADEALALREVLPDNPDEDEEDSPAVQFIESIGAENALEDFIRKHDKKR